MCALFERDIRAACGSPVRAVHDSRMAIWHGQLALRVASATHEHEFGCRLVHTPNQGRRGRVSASFADPVVARVLAESARSIAGGRPRRAATDAPIRVLIVASERLVRLGLVALFARARHCQVVGEASSGEHALEVVHATAPDVVVIDAGASGKSVAAITQRLIGDSPAARVIALAATPEPSFVVESIRAGVRSYLLKQLDAERLVDAVEVVASEGFYITPAVAAAVSEWFRAGRPDGDPIERLSDQERRIVQLIADGKTNRTIAAALGLSYYTVKTYVSSALHKMGLKNRAQVAAAIAQRSAGTRDDDLRPETLVQCG